MFDPGPEEPFVVPEISPQTIVRDHLNLLCFFARRRCNGIGVEAEEFVSMLYIEICRNFSRFDPSRYSLSTWVGYMARQVARQAMRESGRDRAVPFSGLPATDDGIAFDPVDPNANDQDVADDADEAKWLHRQLATLPRDEATAVRARYRIGGTVTMGETAERIGCGAVTIIKMADRAEERLRRRIHSPRSSAVAGHHRCSGSQSVAADTQDTSQPGNPVNQ